MPTKALKALEAALKLHADADFALSVRLARLEAENAKMRAALELLQRETKGHPGVMWLHTIASQALAQRGGQHAD